MGRGSLAAPSRCVMERKIDLPGYEFLNKVGAGGMATVWTARQLSLDRIVAVKVLSPELIRDPEAIERFRQEAHAAAQLKHPGIVQVHDAGAAGGHVYIVMEFIAGCTVAELLQRKVRLGEKHALLIAEGVALALQYAWDEARIIHCDIKPDNVMVEQDGTVKLADLGLAKVIGLARAAVDRELIEGTPHYASPEQARGEPDLDCRADIYSLGAMLYHMVTGRLPFGGTAGLAAMERQITDYLPDPLDLNPELSPGLAWLVEAMMVKDRTLRYPTWRDVLGDLQEVKAGNLPFAKPPGAGQSTVLRSEARSLTPPKPKPKKKKPAPPPDEDEKPKVAKQKIVLPKDLRDPLRNASPKPAVDLTRSFVMLLSLTLAVVIAYGAVTYFHLRKAGRVPVNDEYWSDVLPPRSEVRTAAPASAGAKDLALSTRPSKPAGPASEQTVRWQHPAFLKGARLFNDALAKYKAYQATKQNPSVLPIVESQCREAIAAFESCRAFAPAEVDISALVDQCYRLISDVRQSTLVAPSPKASVPERAKPPPGPTPAAVAASASEAEAKGEIMLAPTWDAPQSGGDKILDDLHTLLGPQGQPGVDLKADPTIRLFGPLCYTMPVQEAARILNLSLAPRRGLNCPGFPKDSFFIHTAEGEFGEGFTEMLLITDGADRIVAVQLVNEHPDKSLWLDPQVFSDTWHAHNFVQARTKGSAKWRIGHEVEVVGRMVRVDSELVANDENGYFGLGDSKERVSLFLPQPIVNLILYRIGKPRGT